MSSEQESELQRQFANTRGTAIELVNALLGMPNGFTNVAALLAVNAIIDAAVIKMRLDDAQSDVMRERPSE